MNIIYFPSFRVCSGWDDFFVDHIFLVFGYRVFLTLIWGSESKYRRVVIGLRLWTTVETSLITDEVRGLCVTKRIMSVLKSCKMCLVCSCVPTKSGLCKVL
jgi:hypothetical protein